MQWKCPSCGFENAADQRECQGGCGYEAIPSKMTLSAVATGKELGITITTQFGKDLLRSFAGDDAMYASSPQFIIVKDPGGGGWFIEHATTAKNPTFVSGITAVGLRRKLEVSSYVTIGLDKMRLNIYFP